ncbi:MAG: PKD domain-containing protein, partial [Acidobacteriota bacterium]
SGATIPGGTVTLQWQRPAKGTDPITYDVFVDGVKRCEGISETQCSVSDIAEQQAVHLWKVIAKNGCGSSEEPGPVAEWRFKAYSPSAIPTADFDWTPKGPLPSFPDQQQPYVGQAVSFQDLSTNAPSAWTWYDFQNDPQAGIIYTTQNPTHTFTKGATTGADHLVRLRATNCVGTGGVTKTVKVYADIRPVVAEFDMTPAAPTTGVPVSVAARQGFEYGDPNVFEWRFSDDSSTATGPTFQHTYNCRGTFQITLTAKRGSFTDTETKTVTVGGELCCEPPGVVTGPLPPSGATIPGGTVVLQWQRPAKGTDPMTYDAWVDGVKYCADISETQCVLEEFPEAQLSHVWKVIAKNGCGSSEQPGPVAEWRFKACSATALPVSDFDWAPQGPLASYPEQQQPYLGQTVNFTDLSTGSPSAWTWWDFQNDPQAGITYTTQNPAHLFGKAGAKTVRMKATNCMGTSTTSVMKTVTIYEDIRPVAAEFSFSPELPQALQPVHFVAGDSDAAGNPNSFTWDFGDGTPPQTGRETDHVFPCSRHYAVTLTAKRIKGSVTRTGSLTRDLDLGGYPCSPLALLTVDLPNEMPGANGSTQHGDLVIFNQTSWEMPLRLLVRPAETGLVSEYLLQPPLPGGGSMTLEELFAATGINFFSASIWIGRADDDITLPVVSAWSYTETTNAGKFGQFLPLFSIWPPPPQATTRWITGLVHNGAAASQANTGFRTILTILNPLAEGWGSKNGKIGLYRLDGSKIRETGLNLLGYGYKQMPLNNWFGIDPSVDLGAVTVKIDIPGGVTAVSTASMLDNSSGTAIVVPSQTAP